MQISKVRECVIYVAPLVFAVNKMGMKDPSPDFIISLPSAVFLELNRMNCPDSIMSRITHLTVYRFQRAITKIIIFDVPDLSIMIISIGFIFVKTFLQCTSFQKCTIIAPVRKIPVITKPKNAQGGRLSYFFILNLI